MREGWLSIPKSPKNTEAIQGKAKHLTNKITQFTEDFLVT